MFARTPKTILHNPHFNLITPEKPKDFPREKLLRKIEDGPLKTGSFLNTNAHTNGPFTSTNDKTRR